MLNPLHHSSLLAVSNSSMGTSTGDRNRCYTYVNSFCLLYSTLQWQTLYTCADSTRFGSPVWDGEWNGLDVTVSVSDGESRLTMSNYSLCVHGRLEPGGSSEWYTEPMTWNGRDTQRGSTSECRIQTVTISPKPPPEPRRAQTINR